MLRKQNKLLSHSLNNQSIPVLVRVCGLLTPVDNVDVQCSPTVIAHLPVTGVRRLHLYESLEGDCQVLWWPSLE